MKAVPVKYFASFLRSALVTIAVPAFAQGTSPWENAVSVLQQAFTSTIARGLSLVAIVVAGITFAFEPSRLTSPIRSISSSKSSVGLGADIFPKFSLSTDTTRRACFACRDSPTAIFPRIYRSGAPGKPCGLHASRFHDRGKLARSAPALRRLPTTRADGVQ